ncbi:MULTISPECIES: anthrone oxygenase family protein [Frankia]|uniref:anthrone oxygenase family protein n=2 Tax=Frankiaceae TaxID=74712 RepID=UPI00031CE630|nr:MULTISPECIES: anthrone oxygenase family protein [Frankia]
MTSRVLPTLTLITAVGAAVVGGVFFAFSAFVMTALRQLPPDQGLAAMQSVNRQAPTAALMLVMFGTAAACVVLGVASVRDPDEPGAWYRLAGAALYLFGVLLTIAYHVPHNDALARVDPTAAGADGSWLRYAGDWTAWNHVRTLLSVAGAVVLVAAVRVGDRAAAMLPVPTR